MLLVYTTLPDEKTARQMAQGLVEQHLAACAHIEAVESFYMWEGKIHDEPEYRLTLKTTAESYPNLESAIRLLHPYEIPAIYAVSVSNSWDPYANWVRQSCAPFKALPDHQKK